MTVLVTIAIGIPAFVTLLTGLVYALSDKDGEETKNSGYRGEFIIELSLKMTEDWIWKVKVKDDILTSTSHSR